MNFDFILISFPGFIPYNILSCEIKGCLKISRKNMKAQVELKEVV
jgi:hypothetical protein